LVDRLIHLDCFIEASLRNNEPVTVAQLAEFDEIIDVRSEAEFAEDHIPGAINCAVLNNEERARVGTIYTQVSPFEAKKIGAALVARNIARHIDDNLTQRPRDWKPLVYCWRGGTRSAALAAVLQQIGWRANCLVGGYKTYRRAVIDDLAVLPARFNWHVICGLTGSGKSRLLRSLALQGAQVIDLEALAKHRGSVLGNLPDEPQPSQKMFESLVWDALHKLDPARPVFVESESKKIGNLRTPEALIAAMWASDCIRLDAETPLRVPMLLQEYDHFVRDPLALGAQLDCLVTLHGRERINAWKAMAEAGDGGTLVRELLEMHYDPAYTRSILSHYPRLAQAVCLTVEQDSDAEFERLAALCIASDTGRTSVA
jgi:tRNA 2-selenouridine synthase